MNWISVKDRLPELEKIVLMTAHEYDTEDGNRFYCIGCRIAKDVWAEINSDGGYDDVYIPTHWAEIIAPEDK